MADRFEEKQRADITRKEDCEKELDLIETKLARLRVLYDQYFMGVEKLEPMSPRTEIEKMLLRSRVGSLGTTVQRFRFRALQHRFTSYCGFWDRIVRLIEEGRIRRGIVGVGASLPKPPDEDSPDEPLSARRRRFKRDIFRGDEEQQSGAAGPQDTPQVPAQLPQASQVSLSPTAPASGPTDFSPADLDAIYSSFITAKSNVGEDTQKITKDLLGRSIERIVSKLPGKEVRIRVINREGSVSLSAVVKKTQD